MSQSITSQLFEEVKNKAEYITNIIIDNNRKSDIHYNRFDIILHFKTVKARFPLELEFYKIQRLKNELNDIIFNLSQHKI